MIRRFDMRNPQELDRGIAAAVAASRRGSLVVLPTEAAYGLATDAFSNTGVASLRELKNRGPELPVPVLVGSVSTVDGIIAGTSSEARTLMNAFWPGQLTLVGRTQPTLNWNVPAAGDDSVSVRMPLHPVAWRVSRELGPLALSGANIAGSDLPRTCDEAADVFGNAVSVYLDAGPATSHETSTTVDVTTDPPRILRVGAVSAEELAAVVPQISAPGAASRS